MSNQVNNCGQSGGVSVKGGTHDGIVRQSFATPEKRGRFNDYSSSNNAENVNTNTPSIALRLPKRCAAKTAASSIAEIVNTNTPSIASRLPKRGARKAATVGYDSDSSDSGSDDEVWNGSPPRGNGNASKGDNTKTAATKKAATKKAAAKKAATKKAEKTVVKRKRISKNAEKSGYKQASNGNWRPTKHITTKKGTANRRVANASRGKIRKVLQTCLEKAKERALPSVIQDTNGAVTYNMDIVCFSTRNRIKLKHSEAFYRFIGWKFPKQKSYASKLKEKFKKYLHLEPDEDYTPAQIRDGATYWSHPKLFQGCDIFAYDAYDE